MEGFQVERINNASIRLERQLRVRRTWHRVFGFALKAAMVACFVVGCLYLLQIRTSIDEINNENINLERENESMRIVIQEITVQIQMQSMLKNIEQTAINEFGMMYPDRSQVVSLKPETQFALDDSGSPSNMIIRLVFNNR